MTLQLPMNEQPVEPIPESEKTKAIRSMHAQLQDVSADVRAIKEMLNAQNKRQVTISVAAKRALKQFFSSIGWLE